MRSWLLDLLICPRCLPGEHPLTVADAERQDNDIVSGSLNCGHCGARFPIEDGVALLEPAGAVVPASPNKYETDELVASYLWSQYGDLLADEQASPAYQTWSGLMTPAHGIALDAGGAVGRFTFEMGLHCERAIGIDTSRAFIRTARRLMREGCLTVPLKEEGLLRREAVIRLPDAWRNDRTEFIVADALALPLRSETVALFASLNLVDKVPAPLQHLQEMNRVCRDRDAQFLLSDPFSWSSEVAPPEAWLGGTASGRFAGQGLENIAALLTDRQGELLPAWRVERHGSVWWKIRTHRNHYELIRSCYLKACR